MEKEISLSEMQQSNRKKPFLDKLGQGVRNVTSKVKTAYANYEAKAPERKAKREQKQRERERSELEQIRSFQRRTKLEKERQNYNRIRQQGMPNFNNMPSPFGSPFSQNKNKFKPPQFRL